MKEAKNSVIYRSQRGGETGYPGLILAAVYILFIAVIITACTKSELNDPAIADQLTAVGIEEILPANLADSVAVDPIVSVTFKSGTDPLTVSSTTITLKQGSESVPGKIVISGTTASFSTDADLTPQSDYTATVKSTKKSSSNTVETKEYSWRFRTGRHHRNNSLSVVSVSPVNRATNVPVNESITVTFNQDLTDAMKKSTSIILKNGSLKVDGTLSFSGKTASFKPVINLVGNTIYSGLVLTTSESDDNPEHSFTWSFTTAGNGVDVKPTVISVAPAINATSVAVNSKPSVTFSEVMNTTTITGSTFTLKQGTTVVAGSVAYTGTIATFTPSAALASSTVYTGTITTGATDASGNALAANYTWNFTTVAQADVTAPTVLSVAPATGAASVAVNSKPSVTFSEAMTASSITASTFTLKQGTTVVAGIVAYSGTTATFTPSAALAPNTVYTGTITTGAKDVAGNSLSANYTWSFTTVAAASAGLSFASDVIPVLNACNTCHPHSWTNSSVASTFYTNLVNSGYVNAASSNTSKLYVKINSGHPGSSMPAADINKILTWMAEGSKNN